MAFGLSPKHEREIALDDFEAKTFLIVAYDVVHSLGWKVGHLSPQGFIAYTNYSFNAGNEEILIRIEEPNVSLKSESMGNQILDFNKNKQNISDLVSNIYASRNQYTPEIIEQRWEELQASMLNSNEELEQLAPVNRKGTLGFLGIFKPVEGYFITPILIDINILVYLIMVLSGVSWISPSSEDLLKWGADFRPMTLDNEWWRLITSCFLHIGILHLLMNMYALFYIGVLMEPYLGKARYLTAYLLTGLVASTTSIWWHDNTVSAGASGAIFGMYGLFLALLTTNFIEKSARQALLSSIGIFVAYNLLSGTRGNTDNAAHIGGLVSGMIMGYALVPGLKKPNVSWLQTPVLVGTAIVFLLGTSFVYDNISNDIGVYQTEMKRFAKLEEEALSVFQLPPNTTKDDYLNAIEDEGIPKWDEILKLLDKTDKLDLPSEYHDRDKLLRSYCELRIRSYEIMTELAEDSTAPVQPELDNINQEIEKVIRRISGK